MAQQKLSNQQFNNALEPFRPLLGIWNTVGVHGMMPNITLHGKTQIDIDETGGFIRITSSIEEDVGIPLGIAIIGSDNELGTYNMSYYDNRGVSRFYAVNMRDNVIKWWRKAPSFSQRYSLTIEEDRQTMVGRGEICMEGSTWETDLNLTYTKV